MKTVNDYPEADANGWIALSKRKPTKEDANKLGEVRWWSEEMKVMVHGELDADSTWTHWKPAGPGPARMERK